MIDRSNQQEIELSDVAGFDQTTEVYHLNESEQFLIVENLTAKPVLSVLRDFSAPVHFTCQRSDDEFAFLMAHDSNWFCRWEAGQTLLTNLITEAYQQERSVELTDTLVGSFEAVLNDKQMLPGIKALMLTLPKFDYLAENIEQLEVDRLLDLLDQLRLQLAQRLQPLWLQVLNSTNSEAPYLFEKQQVGLRKLKACCLTYLSSMPEHIKLVENLYEQSQNMTDTLYR